jgi:hypothetical protein
MKSGALSSSIMNHSIHDRNRSETPPKTVQRDAIPFVVTENPSDPFVLGKLKRSSVTIV